MDPNAPVILTGRHKDQCVRWDCRRLPVRALEYCSVTCQEMATSDSQSTLPFSMANMFSSTTEFAPVAGKILNLLKAEKESGVPRLSQDVFQIPPWQSSTFSFEFSGREEFCQLLFIGSHQIPVGLDFNWVQDRSRMVGEVRHCVLKPSPREDNRWKLHQYSRPDVMEKDVYVMHCNNFDVPSSASEEDEETDSD